MSLSDGIAWEKEFGVTEPAQPSFTVPRVGVGVIVLHNNGTSTRLLLSQRRKPHGFGSWSLPGGKLEGGEKLVDCCARELLEEAGIVVDPNHLEFVGITNDIFPETGTHWVTVYYGICFMAQPQAEDREPDKSGPWAWFKANELPTPLWDQLKRLFDTDPSFLFQNQFNYQSYGPGTEAESC